jgi:4-diphosphocytidyl-2-C-methyl-D-erythritol kinase
LRDRMRGMRLRTYAKVNLFLRVLAKRSDGFHEIETILHGIDLADDLDIEVSSKGGIEVEIDRSEGPAGPLPDPRDNLVVRAAQRLAERAEIDRGAVIRLVKRIPIGAGLGGGSADAAGVLGALNDLWDAGLDHPALLDVASEVGSDVPYCLTGGTTLATGRGEKLKTLVAPSPLWFVLGISDEPLLARDVYDAHDARRPQPAPELAVMIEALGSGDAAAVATSLHNDLERAAFELRPDLESKKASLLAAGAVGACTSGSGPTIFALASDEAHAYAIAGAVSADFNRLLVARSQSRSIERL